MYIDDSIELRSDIPSELQEYFKELRKFYDAQDWFQFDILWELVEVRTKAYYLSGKITREELNQI